MESLAFAVKNAIKTYLAFKERRKANAEERIKLAIKEAKVGIKARRSWNRWWLELLDEYGEAAKEAEYKPQTYPRSMAGAICSVVFNTIFLFLVAWTIWRMVQRVPELVAGDGVTYNINRLDNSGEFRVPALEIRMDVLLTFYEATAPSLQRIDIVDNTGANPVLTSSTALIPTGRGIYQSDKATLGYFDTTTQPLTSPGPVAGGDIDSGTVQRALHSFEESLKVFYQQTSIFREFEDFYDHTAYLYVRFNPQDLAVLKPCQLQVGLFNYGVYKALKLLGVAANAAYQTATFFPTLATDSSTWKLDQWNTARPGGAGWFRASPTQDILVIQSHVTAEAVAAFVGSSAWGPSKVNITAVADLLFVTGKLNLTAGTDSLFAPDVANLTAAAYWANATNFLLGVVDDGLVHLNDFLNWKYVIQYTPNVVTTVEVLTCDGSTAFSLADALVTPPSIFATTLTLLATDGSAGTTATYPTPPFQVLITSAVGQEAVTVTAVGASTLTVTRAAVPLDHRYTVVTGAAFVCAAANFPVATPTAWSCAADVYWASDGCNCGCGAFDPDCCLDASAVLGCALGQTCTAAGACVSSGYPAQTKVRNLAPWVSGASFNVSYAAVSAGCSVSLHPPGDVVLNGFLGSADDFAAAGGTTCAACMGDVLYDGLAHLESDSNYYCMHPATGIARGYDNAGAGITLPTGLTAPTAADGTYTFYVRVDMDAFPTQSYPYLVTVGNTTSLQETAYVIQATALDATTSLQGLLLQSGGAAGPATRKFGLAWLFSAATSSQSSLVVVPNPLDSGWPSAAGLTAQSSPYASCAYFAPAGPYKISAVGQTLSTTRASPSTFKGRIPYQTLFLLNPPAGQQPTGFDVGYVAKLATDAVAGDTVIYIEPMKWVWQVNALGYSWAANGSSTSTANTYLQCTANSLSCWPLLLRGQAGDLSGSGADTMVVTSWVNPGWTCDPSWYGAGDGCDCGCGIVDSDCTGSVSGVGNNYGNGTSLDSSNNCTVSASCYNSTSCAYCSSSGVCASANPGSVTYVTPCRTNKKTQCASGTAYPPPFSMKLTLVSLQSVLWSAVNPLITNKGLYYAHTNGYVVETPITALPACKSTTGTCATDTTKFQDFFNSAFFNVDLQNPVSLNSGASKFRPSERGAPHDPELTTSPSAMRFDAALFTVPDRAGFDTSLSLCPVISLRNNVSLAEYFKIEEYKDWSLLPGRESHAFNCTLTKLEASTCENFGDLPRNVYNEHCVNDMPPTYTFAFTEVQPFNQRWIYPKEKEALNSALLTRPIEYLLDWSTVFTFSHDADVDAVENSFVADAPLSGDKLMNSFADAAQGATVSFYGERFLHGLGAAANGIPAEAPYLKLATLLQPSAEFAASDMRTCATVKDGWNANLPQFGGISAAQNNANVALLKNFSSLNITWEFEDVDGDFEHQTLALLPGYLYTLRARVRVTPYFFLQDYPSCGEGATQTCPWSPKRMQKWLSEKVMGSVVKTKMDYFKRNQAEVRVRIEFLTQQTEIVQQWNYSVKEFLEGIGGAVAFFALTELLIVVTHVCCGTDDTNIKAKKKDTSKETFEKQMTIASRLRGLLAHGYFVWQASGRVQTRSRELVEHDEEEIIVRTIEDAAVRVRIAYDTESNRLQKLEEFMVHEREEDARQGAAGACFGLFKPRADAADAAAKAAALAKMQAEIQGLADLERGVREGKHRRGDRAARAAAVAAKLKAVTAAGVRPILEARVMPRWVRSDREAFVREQLDSKPHMAASILRRREARSSAGAAGPVTESLARPLTESVARPKGSREGLLAVRLEAKAELEGEQDAELADLERQIEERELMHHVNRVRTEDFAAKVYTLVDKCDPGRRALGGHADTHGPRGLVTGPDSDESDDSGPESVAEAQAGGGAGFFQRFAAVMGVVGVASAASRRRERPPPRLSDGRVLRSYPLDGSGPMGGMDRPGGTLTLGTTGWGASPQRPGWVDAPSRHAGGSAPAPGRLPGAGGDPWVSHGDPWVSLGAPPHAPGAPSASAPLDDGWLMPRPRPPPLLSMQRGRGRQGVTSAPVSPTRRGQPTDRGGVYRLSAGESGLGGYGSDGGGDAGGKMGNGGPARGLLALFSQQQPSPGVPPPQGAPPYASLESPAHPRPSWVDAPSLPPAVARHAAAAHRRRAASGGAPPPVGLPPPPPPARLASLPVSQLSPARETGQTPPPGPLAMGPLRSWSMGGGALPPGPLRPPAPPLSPVVRRLRLSGGLPPPPDAPLW